MFHSDSNVWRLWKKTTEHNVVHPQPIIVFWMNACVALSLVLMHLAKTQKWDLNTLQIQNRKKIRTAKCMHCLLEEIQTHRWPKNRCLFYKMPVTRENSAGLCLS